MGEFIRPVKDSLIKTLKVTANVTRRVAAPTILQGKDVIERRNDASTVIASIVEGLALLTVGAGYLIDNPGLIQIGTGSYILERAVLAGADAVTHASDGLYNFMDSMLPE